MPSIIIPTAIRAAMKYLQHNQERVNVLHFTKPGGAIDDGDLSDIAQFLDDWHANYLKNAQSNQLTLDQIQVTDISVPGGHQETLDLATPRPGALATSPAPGNVTNTLSLRTNRVGKRYRGRIYIPGLVDVDTGDDDTISSTQLARLAVVAGQLLIGVPGTMELGVASRVGLFITPVLTLVLENIIDSQRRRLPGRGR